MRVFGGDKIGTLMNRLKVDDDMPIENRLISKSLESAQKKVEGFNFDTRKNVVQYDDVMNRHRKAVYSMRREILMQADISKRIKAFIEEEIKLLVASPDSLTDKFEAILTDVFPFDEETLDRLFDTDANKFEQALQSAAHELYEGRERAFGADILRKVERDIYLQILDNLWMVHLENMDHLREGIHWLSVGQKDPLVEYRRQSQQMFGEMQNSLRHDVLRSVFHARPIDADEGAVETELTRAARQSVDNADKILQMDEFDESDFTPKGTPATSGSKHVTTKANIQKQRKAERQRKKKAKKRK